MGDDAANPPIVWLASYPKSGNTWLRFSVAALIEGDLPSSRFVQERMPDIHESGFKPFLLLEQNIAFAKTHFMFSDSMPGRGLTAGFIYVIRNPIDVLASNYNYILRNAPKATQPLELYVDRYLKNY
ncbi:MAG: sulfotransferase domain-containing protein, partial [Symploca sp. SIO2D2]|nr:sulfotransferase domain-containing protein [Symploca sp. SIO2D2]